MKSRRLLPPLLSLALLASALLGLSGTAHSASDDFEFAQRLAKKRFFSLARRVYEGMTSDANATNEAKDQAKYGLAMLPQEEAIAAQDSTAPYDEVVRLFQGAITSVQDFVKGNPNHPRILEAKLGVGTTHLNFAQWARTLLTDPGEMSERGANVDQVTADARKGMDEAIRYFEGLKPPKDEEATSDLQRLAEYYWVVSHYFKGLVLPACSDEARSTLQEAEKLLDEFISENDGVLLGVFAQDIIGLVYWELAKCERDSDAQIKRYDQAVTWFNTCIDTEDLGAGGQFLQVITSGYYHLGQLCVEAGKPPGRNYLRTGAETISKMLEKHPTARRTENGLRALIEWSKIECKRGDPDAATRVAKDARDKAQEVGMFRLVQAANRQLNEVVSGNCGGTTGGGAAPNADPSVLLSVAEDLFSQGKLPEAIRAYQNVVAAAPDTPEGLTKYLVPAYRRMADAFKKLDDLLAASLALLPIHDAWMDGRIPRKAGDANDANLQMAGRARMDSIAAMQQWADKTGSKVFRERVAQMRDTMSDDYPNFGTEVDWPAGLDKFNQAMALRKANNPTWPQMMEEARKFFRKVAKNSASRFQDDAWPYIARSYIVEKKAAEALAAADEGWAFWNSPPAKEQEAKFPEVRARRRLAQGQAAVWKADALSQLSRHKEVVALLGNFFSEYVGLPDPFPTLARNHLINAHIELGEIDKADVVWNELLRTDPKSETLPNLAKRFAGYYNEQYRGIQDQLRAVEAKLRGKDGVTARHTRAARNMNNAANTLPTLHEKVRKLKELIAAYEKQQAAGGGVINRGDFEAAQRELPETEKKIVEQQSAYDKAKAEEETLRAEETALQTQRAQHKQDLFGPLVKAAEYYLQWDMALKASGVAREPDTVFRIAEKFFYAATLKPEELEMWRKARMLYEDYLGFPQVEQAAPTDKDKRTAVANLGRTYVQLAQVEPDANARRELLSLAVERLQASIANIAENNPLVVSLLAGELVVLPWTDPNGNRFRFAVKRVGTVKELRDAVENLGKPGGTPVPRWADARQQTKHDEAVAGFKRYVKGLPDETLAEAVRSFEKAGVDWGYYRDHANVGEEFRLALAQAYAGSGRKDDAPKAVRLAASLVDSAYKTEEEGEVWWMAMTLRLQAYLAAAELAGPKTAEQTQWLEAAKRFLRSTAVTFTDIGEAVVPGTRATWQKELARLNALLTSNGIGALEVDLSGKAASKPPPSEGDENAPADGGGPSDGSK